MPVVKTIPLNKRFCNFFTQKSLPIKGLGRRGFRILCNGLPEWCNYLWNWWWL